MSKSQEDSRFGQYLEHLDFGDLNLFRISYLVLRISGRRPTRIFQGKYEVFSKSVGWRSFAAHPEGIPKGMRILTE